MQPYHCITNESNTKLYYKSGAVTLYIAILKPAKYMITY